MANSSRLKSLDALRGIAALVCLYFALIFLVIKNKLSFLANDLFVYLGTISYSLYLIHQEIGYILILKYYSWTGSYTFSIALALASVLILADILWRLVEVPSNSKIKRLLLKSS